MASASANAMSARASSKSPEPALGFNVPDQMEVDRPGSRGRPEDPSVLASPAHASLSSDFEQALIPPTSSVSRLPTTVPSSVTPTPTSHQSHVAISAQQNIDYNTYTSQDVHHFVNNETSSSSSSATRTFGQPSTHETSVSSFPPPITQHGLNHPIRRPRTSTVFSSATDLAAHYGIPQRLPPAPRTTPRYQPPTPKPAQVYPDFQTLSANYLNMLSNKPTDNTMAATSTTNAPVSAAAVTTADLNAPLIPTNAEDHLRDIAAMLVNSSPEFQDMDDFEKYMTSPMPALDDDFGTSPLETPYADFLNTPLFPEDDDMLTSPYMNDLPLFPSMPDYPSEKAQESVVQPAPQFNLESLYTISPETPLLQSFDPSAPSVPRSALPTPPATIAKTTTRRASSKATGIRKGITPDDLLDESAPTQPRKYTMPSVTSKKELPAVFARKRARSAAFGDEEDQLGDDLPPNPTEKDLIEAKRRQNTVAARRSRKRKLEQLQTLEKSRDEERALKEQWQERANMLLGVLRGMGVTYPDFPPDEVKYST